MLDISVKQRNARCPLDSPLISNGVNTDSFFCYQVSIFKNPTAIALMIILVVMEKNCMTNTIMIQTRGVLIVTVTNRCAILCINTMAQQPSQNPMGSFSIGT